MLTSVSGSFSGLVAYRDNTSKPFRGTFDSHQQEFDQFGLSTAIDALSDTRVAESIVPFVPLAGSFVGVPPGVIAQVQSTDSLNMTIDGGGYFILVDPDTGTNVYARNILMRIRPLQTLAFGKYEVQPAITLPGDTVSVLVAPDGMVSAELSDLSTVIVGQIQLSGFATPPTDIGGGLFVEGASPPIFDVPGNPGYGSLKQGFVETMNPARNDVGDVVLRIDAVITQEDNSQLTFALVYESGITHFIGTVEAVNILRTAGDVVSKFNKMLQNATGDSNLMIEPM